MITPSDLESILTSEGIVSLDAIEDPEGYDGGTTQHRIRLAAQRLNELITAPAPAPPASPPAAPLA